MTTILIQPNSNNINTQTKILFGKNVSLSKVIEFIKKEVELKENCGMISFEEAKEIVKQTEKVLKDVIQEIHIQTE
jgi:hypothetical protein